MLKGPGDFFPWSSLAGSILREDWALPKPEAWHTRHTQWWRRRVLLAWNCGNCKDQRAVSDFPDTQACSLGKWSLPPTPRNLKVFSLIKQWAWHLKCRSLVKASLPQIDLWPIELCAITWLLCRKAGLSLLCYGVPSQNYRDSFSLYTFLPGGLSSHQAPTSWVLLILPGVL